ncbi:hypothetical protein D7X74_33340 [Corallococcus sp. CA047B]|uniref:hypothetical protein n=1 Tax=Corallococcus sp. CA047B TaxID=2316729 RepID=UPI000EA1DE32|nr:hypothetical protein [Corallococcus sp. CA047B]RKH06995.1 hypothetical protein D7X74_33340 [Corallococcus sp. CA047B]
MTSIRRVGSGISTSRAYSISSQLEVTAPVRKEPLAPVDPVRRGFSDDSDFQADAEGDLNSALFADLGPGEAAPNAAHGRAGVEAPEPRAALMENSQLRAFAGVSEFEASAPSYAQRLGMPTSTPLMQARLANAPRRAEEVETDPSMDPSDILSPDAAAWELQNLDTMPRSVSAQEAEDLLFLLESGDLSGLSDEELRALSEESGDDADLDASGATAGSDDFLATLDDSVPDVEYAEGSMNIPPPDDFLADVNDFTLETAPEAQEAAQPEAPAEAAPAFTHEDSVVVAQDLNATAPAFTHEDSVVVAPDLDATAQAAGLPVDAAVLASAEADVEDVQDADLLEAEAATAPPAFHPPES